MWIKLGLHRSTVRRYLKMDEDTLTAKLQHHVDKFKEMRLTPQPSRYIKAPGIAESPVNI